MFNITWNSHVPNFAFFRKIRNDILKSLPKKYDYFKNQKPSPGAMSIYFEKFNLFKVSE